MTKFDAVRTQALILRQSARGSFKVISKDSGYLSKCGALRRQLPTKPGSRFGNEVALYVVSQRLLEQAGVEVGQETVAGLYTACPPLGGAGRHGAETPRYDHCARSRCFHSLRHCVSALRPWIVIGENRRQIGRLRFALRAFAAGQCSYPSVSSVTFAGKHPVHDDEIGKCQAHVERPPNQANM
jgi:hypothetical protein